MRTEYDVLGRETSTWVGTDDTPASGYWSPTNNTSPSNMVEVSSNIYDNGGSGDGNLTESIAYAGGLAANRATLNFYDWRDRLVASKQGALVDSSGVPTPSSETDGVHRPISYATYDNLGEVTTQQSFDGDGVTITTPTSGTTVGVPTAPSSSLLRAEAAQSYDDQGRVYASTTYSVDPTSGTVGSGITSNTFYDHNGNTIATFTPGQPTMKSIYDGAGRVITSYTTDGGAVNNSGSPLMSWSDANSVANDVVVSETDTTYDADGDAILTTTKDRLPTASTTRRHHRRGQCLRERRCQRRLRQSRRSHEHPQLHFRLPRPRNPRHRPSRRRQSRKRGHLRSRPRIQLQHPRPPVPTNQLLRRRRNHGRQPRPGRLQRLRPTDR
jgi:YD repeat-containing protein